MIPRSFLPAAKSWSQTLNDVAKLVEHGTDAPAPLFQREFNSRRPTETEGAIAEENDEKEEEKLSNGDLHPGRAALTNLLQH